jgi:DNA-directed RNA polymerase subunit N (RpoN/RPB10)
VSTGGFQLTLQRQRGFGGCNARQATVTGGRVLAEKQQRYLQLIAQGVNNSEACRQVGIDRKTGNRWRYGRKVKNSAGRSSSIRR